MRLTLVWKFILFSSITRKTNYLIRLQMKKVFSTVRMGHSIKTLHSREGHNIVPKWHNARRKVRGLLKCHVTAFVHFWTKFHHKDLGKSIILLKEKSQVTWGMEYKTISPNVTWWGRWSQINQKCHILFEWFLIRLERKLKGKNYFTWSWECLGTAKMFIWKD